LLTVALPSAWKNGLTEIPYNATTVSALHTEIKKREMEHSYTVQIFCETYRNSNVANIQSKKKFWAKK
jgi:hypothetical protein